MEVEVEPEDTTSSGVADVKATGQHLMTWAGFLANFAFAGLGILELRACVQHGVCSCSETECRSSGHAGLQGFGLCAPFLTLRKRWSRGQSGRIKAGKTPRTVGAGHRVRARAVTDQMEIFKIRNLSKDPKKAELPSSRKADTGLSSCSSHFY